MTNKQIACEALGYALIILACLGWMDFGQGKEYTWWNMIVYVANY